jgi:hypothetical protein
MSAAAAATPVDGEYSGRRPDLTAYARPYVPRSLLDLATSVLPYFGLSLAMYWLLDLSYLLAASCCARTSSSTTARTDRSCPRSARICGWAACSP